MLYERWSYAMVYLAIIALVGTTRFASAAPLPQATTTTTTASTSRSQAEKAKAQSFPENSLHFPDRIPYPPPAKKPFKGSSSPPNPVVLDRKHADWSWGDDLQGPQSSQRRPLSVYSVDSSEPEPRDSANRKHAHFHTTKVYYVPLTGIKLREHITVPRWISCTFKL
ncbi:hypothetical protein EV360DRAFT_73448 [Lentinula raphanica]|nr:hypothetical protein EV360DRAFT_73448 [Lentinula raphanica]